MGMESFKQPPENKMEESESEQERNRAREEFKQKEPFFLQALQATQNAEELKFAAKLGAVEIRGDKVLWDEGMGTGVIRWVDLTNTLEAIDNLAKGSSTEGRDVPYSILVRAKELFKQKE